MLSFDNRSFLLDATSLMSFLITCPNCGPRDVTEFNYGGQILASGASNLPGRQQERWYHRFGCRRWLRTERDVRTNQVFATAWLGEDR
jgi:sarcosine oxidase subunit delta